MDLTLLNFIIYYFLQINMKALVSFNCWDVKTNVVFYKMAADKSFYIDAININNSQAIQGIQYRLWGKKPTMGIFMDLNCESSEKLLDIVSRERLFNDHFFWLIYDNMSNVTYFRARFTHINLAVDAELTYAYMTSVESDWNSTSFSAYTLYDVYNNGYYYGGKLNMTLDREVYCTQEGCEVNRYLSKLHLRSKYGNRNRLHDITLRLAVVVTAVPSTAKPEEIFSFLRSINDTSKDAIARFGFQALSILVEVLGCKSNHSFTNRWTINETHGGLIGALAVHSADLISTPFIPTPPRMAYFTIIAETSTFRSICLFRTPRNSGIQGDVFLKPFNTTVWLLFGLLLLLAAIVLWSIFRVEHKRMHQRYIDYMPSILATFLISFGSACSQGSEMVPSSIGGRIVFFTLYLLTFLMYNYYTSIVVSSLLGSPVKSDIKTMGQLADSSLQVGLEPLPFTLTYLNNSLLPEVRRFKRKIDSTPNPKAIWMPLKEGILRVRDQPGFVFGFEASTGYLLVKRYYKPYEICDLNEILFRPEKSLFSAVHKNSSFKEVTKQRIYRILETGVSLKLHRYWVQLSLECFDSNFIVEVGMEYMAPLFMLLLCTYFLVIFILLLEILHKKYWVDHKMRLENIMFGDNWHPQQYLLHITNDRMWYTRFVSIESTDLTGDFEYRYLLHSRSILGAYLDMNCNKSEDVMNILSHWSLYNQHYKWLLYDRTADLHNFKRIFMNASLSVDAELTYALLKPALMYDDIATNTTSYITYDVYNNGYALGGKLNVTIDREIQCNREDCQLRRYFSDLHLRSKYGNRLRLHDVTMRVSTVVTKRPLSLPPSLLLEFLNSENNTEIDVISRFGFKVLLIFRDLFGCKMLHTFRDRWSMNETFGGIIGDLISKDADFASSPFLSTKPRQKYLSVIIETGGYRQLCLFRTPRSNSMRGEAFLKPFDTSVWVVFIILLAVLAVFLWRTFALELRSFHRHMPYEPSLLAITLLAFGSACYQGSNIVPFSLGGRLAYFSLYSATFMMYNYYTSILLSTLLGTPVKSDIKTLGQLADSPLDVGLDPLPFIFVFLNSSQLPEVRRFVLRKIESKPHPEKVWIPVEEGILRVRDDPGFVYALETSTGYSFLERNFLPHEICDLNEVLLRPDRGLLTQLHRNSTYKELTRLRASRMMETGVWRKHRRYWIKEKLSCVQSNYLFAVGMEYTAPLFLMLVFSFALCLVLLLLELGIKRILDQQRDYTVGFRKSTLAEEFIE